MSIDFFDVVQTKQAIIEDLLNHCRHLLELDFLREQVTYVSNDDEHIHALAYTIRQIPEVSMKYRNNLGKLPHLLFYNYPEFVEPHSMALLTEKAEPPSHLYLKWLSEILGHHASEFVSIPQCLQNDVFNEISLHMSVSKALHIMTESISLIQKNKFVSRMWAVYVCQYKSLTEKLSTLQFNTDERRNIHKLLQDLNVLTMLVESDIEKNTLQIECNSLRNVNEQNIKYQTLLDAIECIDVHLESEDTGTWLDPFVTELNVSVVGNVVSIRSNTPEKLLELYSTLCARKNINARLVMNELGDVVEKTDMIHHIIEGESTLWAYVFYKLFGSQSSYTKEQDDFVKQVLHASKLWNISVDYMLGEGPRTNEEKSI